MLVKHPPRIHFLTMDNKASRTSGSKKFHSFFQPGIFAAHAGFASWPVRRRLFAIALIGLGMRCYGLFDHWKVHDHYNFGGPFNAAFVECLNETPWSVSKGIPHTGCETKSPDHFIYYRNHPPFLYWSLVVWTQLLGYSEWVYRSFTLIFSILNIVLVFQVARKIWPDDDDRALWSAFFQSFFLGGIYFGTHVDMPAEFTATFWLLGTGALLSNAWGLAILFVLGAGLTDWPGFFMLVGLLVLAFYQRRHRLLVSSSLLVSGVMVLAIMAYMQQTVDLWTWLQAKLTARGYEESALNTRGILGPVNFVYTLVQHLARLLGPLFAGFFLLGLARLGISLRGGSTKSSAAITFHVVLALWSVTALSLFVASHRYVMVHVFWLIPLLPLAAWVCGDWVAGWEGAGKAFLAGRRKWLVFSLSLFIIFYPYGLYKSNPVHDALNSLFLGGTALVFLVNPFMSQKNFRALILIAALANFSQVANYRNEEDTEHAFCEEAKAYYKTRGQPLKTDRSPSPSSAFYCRGTPVIYDAK
ncbi:MAG: hypothetical protein C5B49_00595 [Bdellovibrio sp.]|nr:MAG: hypothetical protein C5B49_00595 [Bdellovibrio sp.]